MEFIELLAKTNYSFLEGASHPEEMLTHARGIGYTSIGIADRNGVYGIPRAHVEAKRLGMKLIVGAEIKIGSSQVAHLIVKNRNGYGNLCQLLTEAHSLLEEKQRATAPLSIPWNSFLRKSEDLFILLPSRHLDETIVPTLKDRFQRDLFLVASRFFNGKHRHDLDRAEEFSRRFELPCIASNEPLFHIPARKPVQDILTCIRYTKTLREAGFLLQSNGERHLKPLAAMKELFSKHPEWLAKTLEIAAECHFSLDEIRYEYPNEWLPKGETPQSYLRRLTEEGLKNRYPHSVPQAVRTQLERELALIKELRYEDYFLTIWDIVTFARSKAILCQGRGSAANSLVCYLLGITSIDPIRMDLLFERFISKERNEPPDIDIDFEHERREEVIQYIYERYGRDRAAITAEVICFRRRSAFREVGKVFEIPLTAVEKILTLTHREDLDDLSAGTFEKEVEIERERFRHYWHFSKAILSFPRHLGTHVGGFVLSQDLLTRNVPVERAAMPGRTIIQWDKDDLDSLGFLKVDILGLGILTCIRKSFDLLKKTCGIHLDLATIPAEDSKVYEAMARSDTIGVFQIESRAQMNMLPRLKPINFFDLIVEISLVRPGPIHGDMVHPYLLRREGKEKVDYAHPELESILKKTYGVPIFQEQVMKMAMKVAGFTAGEADELRRAMGAWRRRGNLSEIGERFRKGLLARGIDRTFADRILKQVEGFAEYGFPESHAASFAILAYATAYLKYYYPGVFLTALLNSQPMGFYSPLTLIYDGKRHGVDILPIDIQKSDWDNTLQDPLKMRMGFREIKGMNETVARRLVEERHRRPFSNLTDLITRVPFTKRDLFFLAGANALSPFGLSRRDALWEIQGLELSDSPYLSAGDIPVELPKESRWEGISLDFQAQGICLNDHPMAFLRKDLDAEGILSSQALKFVPKGKRVMVGGIVICRQMPDTASNVLFITLEDEYGFTNLVIWRDTHLKYREPLLTQSFLKCHGKVDKSEKGRIIHVMVEKAEPLLKRDVPVVSHDFH